MAKAGMIRIGMEVRLKRTRRGRQLITGHETAKVKAWIADIPGGVRLDRRLCGFSYWNRADLERAPKPKRRLKKQGPLAQHSRTPKRHTVRRDTRDPVDRIFSMFDGHD